MLQPGGHAFLVHEAKGGAAGAGLDDDVLGLIVFKADVSDPDSRLETWSEDDKRPCAWDGE